MSLPSNQVVTKVDMWFWIVLCLAVSLVLLPCLVALHLSDSKMANKVLDCTVHIRATDMDSDPWSYESEYEFLYGQSWQGSGSFISADGIIVTAGHIVDEAEEFEVTLRDGRKFTAKYWMKADNMDVGFLKIEVEESVPFLVFDWTGLDLLENVCVVGHPYGTDNLWNITKGVVSCLDRDCEGFFGVFPVIQVDSASYPGNSGGPVVDMKGRIVGILVGGYGGNECISYVTPTWIAKEWFDVFDNWLDTRP